MKTKTINLYQFEEITDQEIKDRIIEKNRDINTEYDWSDFIIEDAQEQLKEIGFMEPEIYFSGFHSQGDGLCFDCSYIDLLKVIPHIEKNFLKKHNITKNRLKIISEYCDFLIYKNSYANHYSHEKTHYIDISSETSIFKGKYLKIEQIVDYIKDCIEELRVSLCREYYKQLNDEYDYRMSDKSIEETLISNEYYFDLETLEIEG